MVLPSPKVKRAFRSLTHFRYFMQIMKGEAVNMTFAEVQAESLLSHTCANGRDLAKRAVFPTHTDNDRNTLQMIPLKQQYKNYTNGI